MAHILGIGIATLDIINTVDGYPPEDAEVRAVAQRIARGGNVANTLVVLSQLGHDCAWGGVLAEEPDAGRIVADLRGHGVDLSGCRRLGGGKVPVSYVTLNARNGSRTIVHYRDLPEFSADDFAVMEFRAVDWVHFEGRNVAATERMLGQARERYPNAVISVEVEKPRADIENLFAGADLLLFSRRYAQAKGYAEPQAFLASIHEREPGVDLVCAWGESGAHGLNRAGVWSSTPAFAPTAVVDTLGAGDTFNAGVIDGRLRGFDWPQTLAAAAQLAGRKCGQIGFAGLARDDD